MNKLFLTLSMAGVLFLTGCNREPSIDDGMLDGDVIFDASLYNPEDFLVSAKYPRPTAEDLDKHIILAIHGYSASTFEWQEFQDWTSDTATYRISQVLLRGHGRTYEEFKESTWRDWRIAIAEEYERLERLGYTKISLVGSSTGGSLLLELVSSGYFNEHINPKNIFLIDPILVGSAKVQSLAGIIGPMLGYVEFGMDGVQNQYWYRFRPQETIRELNNLMKDVRKSLEKGMTLPSGTYLKCYHSKHDPTASSTAIVMIYKGLQTYSGGNVDVEVMDSKIHVFTRLALRDNITSTDYANQLKAFEEMSARLD